MIRTGFGRWGVAVATLLLVACGDGAAASSAAKASAGPRDRPGLGSSTAAPQGATFSLPAGIELEGPIKGYSGDDPVECDDKYGEHAYGHGELVRLCLIFRNQTNQPITVTLPPGLMFVARDLKIQNGLIPQRIAIEVPPGERFFAPVYMYCANGPRRPSSTQSEYDLGPIIQDADFQEFFALLEGKVIVREDTGVIQVAIDSLQDGEGLKDSHRVYIAGL